MIRNRYNYLTPSVQDTDGKKDALQNSNTIKPLQAESQKDSLFPKIWQTAIKKKTQKSFHQDI